VKPCPQILIACAVPYQTDSNGCSYCPQPQTVSLNPSPTVDNSSVSPLSFLTNPINLFGMSIPLWGLIAAGGLLLLALGGRK